MKINEWKSLLYDVLDLQKKVFKAFSLERCFEVCCFYESLAFFMGVIFSFYSWTIARISSHYTIPTAMCFLSN